ncbi:MAG: 16S rRNA (guanine(966)-N(2))-methyltransferase RsmD [Calditrichaeota bacterium]|nr:MAG: 16S rRNA (guanine(966)-N(2))-methyltransferase RsmD [Calditrichota bacterium]
MRVIAGSAKGTKLLSPAGKDTRPTTDRAKQKLFDTLRTLVEQPALALDLFSGSGALGIEALSRGAGRVVFIEKNRAAAEIIRKNLEKTHLSQKSEIFVNDAFLYLNKLCTLKYDLIFADPPYQSGYTQKLINIIISRELLHPNGLLVVEDTAEAKQKVTEGLTLIRTKVSGYTAHYIFEKSE